MKIQREHFSPQLFKDPECWSARSHDLPHHSPVHNQVSHRCAVVVDSRAFIEDSLRTQRTSHVGIFFFFHLPFPKCVCRFLVSKHCSGLHEHSLCWWILFEGQFAFLGLTSGEYNCLLLSDTDIIIVTSMYKGLQLAFVTFLSSLFVVSFSFLVVLFTHILYECFPLVAIIHCSDPFI